MSVEALGGHALTVESCDNREREMREWMQSKIDAEDRKIRTLEERIVKAMQSYRSRYSQKRERRTPASTQPASIAPCYGAL